LKEQIFENPTFLYLLVLIPILALGYFLRRKTWFPDMGHSAASKFGKPNWKQYLVHSPIILKSLAFGLIVIALARPRTSSETVESITKSGIDIVLAMDVSTSMKALDFKPNRLEAAKNIAIDFVEGRINDRIGIVIYAGESFTQCPITSDYKLVKNMLKNIKFGVIEDGTAIGMGIATGVSRLKDSKADSKVIILLTDGENNRGLIDPYMAIELAQEFNIKVYTIGVGKKGKVPYPGVGFGGRQIIQQMDSKVDEKLLKEIADNTGGHYFRATNNEKLSAIYKEIELLEKTEIQEFKYVSYQEKFRPFALAAFVLLLLIPVLKFTILKGIN